LQRIGFRGGTTIYVAHGHHPSADSGLSLANDKRARLSVVSPRLGQQPARLASQRHTPLHVGAQLTAQSTGWQASALIFSLCRQEMVRSFLQTHRYPSGSTRGEVEKILRNRGWGPRNDLPDDGGGDIGHDVKAGPPRQDRTCRPRPAARLACDPERPAVPPRRTRRPQRPPSAAVLPVSILAARSMGPHSTEVGIRKTADSMPLPWPRNARWPE